MKEEAIRWWIKAILLILLINSCFVMFLWLWKLSRIYAIDFAEPCIANLVQWWRLGKIPYTWPNELPILKNPYGPVYEWICKILPFSSLNPYFSGRTVSLISTLYIMVLCTYWVYRRSGNLSTALLSSLILLTSKPFFEWVPKMRVDMLAGALSLSGFALVMFVTNKLGVLMAAIVLSAAFHTKFTAICGLISSLITLWLTGRKRDAVFLVIFWIAIAGIFCIWLSLLTQGAYPLATQIGNMPTKWSKIFDMATRPLTTTLFWILAITYIFNKWRNFIKILTPEISYTIVGIIIASLTAANPGSSWNYLTDFYIGLSITTGTVIGQLINCKITVSKTIIVLFIIHTIFSPLHFIYCSYQEIKKLNNYYIQYKMALNRIQPLIKNKKKIVIISSMSGTDVILHFGKVNLISLDIPENFFDIVFSKLLEAKREGLVDIILIGENLKKLNYR